MRSGLTAVHSNDENAIEVYTKLQEEDRLPVRVYLTLPHDELDKQLPAAGNSGRGTGGGWGDAGKPKPWSGDEGLLSWNRVKLFSDGSLGACAVPARLRECSRMPNTNIGHTSAQLELKKGEQYFSSTLASCTAIVRVHDELLGAWCALNTLVETHEALAAWKWSMFC